MCLRYILEGLDEREILDIDRQAEVANCSITEYRFDHGRPVLERYNFVAPLAEAEAPVTRAPDASVAAG